ncbi:MAG: Fur family transcriptional regulator [Acidaminococcaceae bacterium]|nr:Fur family transcriptional regulator [Acidaminococcaceae bacterium]MDD4721386.1 Fur family transcriptional regulator [Acidaminococcaceae bacterium]
MERTSYRTKQAEKILSYLKLMAGNHVTAKDITEYFCKRGETIGTATIYRHLDKMVEQGTVKKYTVDRNTAACFQLTQAEGKCSEHFHLKCEKCGKLIHFDCVEFAHMQEHLAKKHGFAVNSLKTVLYGLCNECNNKK